MYDECVCCVLYWIQLSSLKVRLWSRGYHFSLETAAFVVGQCKSYSSLPAIAILSAEFIVVVSQVSMTMFAMSNTTPLPSSHAYAISWPFKDIISMLGLWNVVGMSFLLILQNRHHKKTQTLQSGWFSSQRSYLFSLSLFFTLASGKSMLIWW